jgi:hypothetical protein
VRLALFAGVVGLVVGGAGGCSTTTERSYSVDVPEGVRLVGVDVENFAGDVVVRAARGSEPSLDAYVTVSGDAGEELAARLREAVDVRMSVEEASPGVAAVRVRSDSALAGEGLHDVRLELVVPRADGVRVENRGGLVELIGVGGRIEVSNSGGLVLVRTDRVLDDFVRVLNVDGDVIVQAPDGSAGSLRLESLDGEVRVKDPYGRTRDTEAGKSLVTTVLAGGENEIDLRTSRGAVAFLVMEDPEGFSRAVAWEPPAWRDWFGRDSSRRYTRNLPDEDVPEPVSIGDGSYYGPGGSEGGSRDFSEAGPGASSGGGG